MNKKGFTLVELLAVIVILAALVIIAVPAISNVLKGGREQAKDINYDTVLNAAYDYMLSENITVDSEEKIAVCNLIKRGYLKQDTKDGMGNALNDEDYVSITKITYVSGTEYKNGSTDKYFNNYHFVYNKADGSVTCASAESNGG